MRAPCDGLAGMQYVLSHIWLAKASQLDVAGQEHNGMGIEDMCIALMITSWLFDD
jgi:hypothetical protein